MTERLRLTGVTKSFGGLSVAADINLSLSAGDRTALIGPNGAGKTTLVNLISGALQPSAGDIHLDGLRVNRLDQAARTRAGIARTFQVSRLCRDLTVIENVLLPLIQRHRAAFRMWPASASDHAIRAEAVACLEPLGLAAVAGRRVSELAYGEQRLVEIAIAIALKPRVLLLDEPAAGVPESESGMILDVLARLPRELPILLIEHDMDLVFRFARRVIVLVAGAILFEGTPAEVAANQTIRDIYLGRDGHGAASL
ncbi:MAG TPA: ABC transporter ATP-binding protein [Bradyrhizobium sp.]|jgi:branched-chain amino acid transport system ATP-binding protein|nr:ABC transporter ATP-binding protein [Bradyrhizobium sp.]